MERTILPSDFRRKRHDYNGGVGAGKVGIGEPIITVRLHKVLFNTDHRVIYGRLNIEWKAMVHDVMNAVEFQNPCMVGNYVNKC